MKFKLNVIKQGQPLVYTYDSADSTVYDQHGNCLIGKYIDPPQIKPFTSQHNPNFKSKKLNELEISLGFNCNFKCKYCGQLNLKHIVHSARPSDVDDFLDILNKSGIEEPNCVQFWGGEPLVYWKTLRQLLPKLRVKFPSSYFAIITNGKLLTKDKIDLVKSLAPMTIGVSYDCIKQTEKSEDIMTDQMLDTLIYAKQQLGSDFKIFVTLTPGNVDLVRIKKYLSNLFGSDINIAVWPLKCRSTSGIFTTQEIDKLNHDLFDIINQQDTSNAVFGALSVLIDQFTHSLVSHEPIELAHGRCALPYSKSTVVDLKGNMYNCHIRPTPIGSILDLESISATNMTSWKEHEYCHKCPFIHICGGNCHTLPANEHAISCINFRPYAEAIFRACLSRLLGVYVESVEYDKSIHSRVILLKNEVDSGK